MTNWTFLGWYYRQGREQIGPVGRDEIARLVGRGHLRPSAEVLKGWKDANNRIRFFGSPAGACLAESSPLGKAPGKSVNRGR
jgi:hypothetical protein